MSVVDLAGVPCVVKLAIQMADLFYQRLAAVSADVSSHADAEQRQRRQRIKRGVANIRAMKARICFRDIRFRQGKGSVEAVFMSAFSFNMPEEKLRKISDYCVESGCLVFSSSGEESARRKLNLILQDGFRRLSSRISCKPAVYIHRNSGIPLIGTNYFGLIDRGTNLIELKPITGCNLKCIYCSVDEDRRQADFVVEKEYLLAEAEKLVRLKGADDIEIHIAAQGEPLLYQGLESLVKGLSGIKGVARISLDTNGVLLTEKKADLLIDSGLARFNISLNAVDERLASEIAGAGYSANHVMGICRHIASRGEHLLIAPVLLPGINEGEMEKIVGFAMSLKHKPIVGIQNFLEYRFGRNPVRGMEFERFYSVLKKLEKKSRMMLIFGPEDFGIRRVRELEKPFRKGDRISADIMCIGRMKSEMIAAAKGRCISVPGCSRKTGKARLIITRSKHNVFFADEL